MKKRTIRSQIKGFTLAEMAIVMVLITLLIGGLMSPLTAQRDADARRNTQQALNTAREALFGYAIQHGRLPCPARMDIPTGATGAGIEATIRGSGDCACTSSSAASSHGISGNSGGCNGNTVFGVLPWVTLGLDETDAWNNRYSYLVTAYYARTSGIQSNFDCDTVSPEPPPNNAAFALCSKGLGLVRDSSSLNWSPLTTANEAPAIVVSHGNNGLGAYGPNGLLLTGAGGDELANSDGDAIFISNTKIDDLLVWISRPVLMNRMIAAGRLP
ncbi:MAG TPA: type II secretion system protein [Rhodocyclaceae bacterium]|jgi:type II secretory pathway pseudopilin PulG|nr:type II secretion system protein [Rhodocyclaceae bacterium]